MKKAFTIGDVKCNCNKAINAEVFKHLDEKSYKRLSDNEGNIVGAEEFKFFKCSKCSQEKKDNEIRRMDCCHDYCVGCIKTMMKKSEVNLTCTHIDSIKRKICNQPFNTCILINVDKEVFNIYNENLARRFAMNHYNSVL